MKRLFLSLVLISFAFQFSTGAQNRINYPAAKRIEQTDEYHGVKVADPYRWMENAEDSKELAAWIKAQDELLKNFAGQSSRRSAIQKRLSELIEYDSYTNATGFMTPYVAKRNSRYFFIKTGAGSNQPTLFVRENTAAEPRVLLDTAARYGAEKINLSGYEPSPDGKFVALFLAKENSRWLTLKILDVETGKELRDVLENTHRLSSNIAWTSDGKGFFYTKFEKQPPGEGQPGTPVNPKIFRHKLGDLQNEDSLIYEKPDDQNMLFTYQVTADGKYLVIDAINGSNPHNRIFYLEISAPPIKPLFEKEDALYTFLGSVGTKFWFYTNLQAPRGRIAAVDVRDKQPALKEIIPQVEEPISAGSRVGGNAVGIFGRRIVLLYMRDSNPLIKIFDLGGKFEKEITLPSGGTVWGGFSGRQDDPEIIYEYLGLTSPATFYRLNVVTKKNEIFLRPKLKLDPADYETKQVFFKSRDGTRVPMFIAHRKGLKLDGENPAFMYGYGAMGWVAFMWYQPHILTWLEMGGVYAVPGIRGGGEYGEDWHQAGVKQNKQNSVDDYLAAARFLIKNKYTNPKKMVANGGSASSPIVAAAVIQRPEIFGAAVLDIPAFDMLRYQKFANGRYWVSEFGSSENENEFGFLKSFSPYHNITEGRCYPPVLVMVGEKDQVAAPLHAYKFTARMQYAQGCKNPVLMKMMWGAGHNFGSTPEQRIDSWTDELAFLFEVFK